MSASFDLTCDRLTVGSIGPSGQRIFFLQAREGEVLVTLKLEKTQVAALAARLGQLLHDNRPTTPIPEPDDLPLEEPAVPDWVVGSMQMSFATDDDNVVLLCQELVLGGRRDADDDDDDETGGGGAVARLGCTRAQAAALAMRGATLVAVGARPACPLCGYPLDPRGHACPKTNGHSPPRL